MVDKSVDTIVEEKLAALPPIDYAELCLHNAIRVLILAEEAVNSLTVYRKGSDAMPAKAAEISALTKLVSTTPHPPVICGDHRLMVDIVSSDDPATLLAIADRWIQLSGAPACQR